MKEQRVLVTGAGGSIGSELCLKILEQQPDELVLLNLTENGLYNTMKKLRSKSLGTDIVPVLGTVNDWGLVRRLTENADIVIHAGAHKHVPLCELNVVEAIRNNIFGTAQLISAVRLASSVRKLVFVSTDKAVHPKSVMGATKRVGELLMHDAAEKTRDKDFLIVRFGNVLDSSGSVLPLWREQIAAGGPITLTDKRCTRFFMSIPEACELIMQVIENSFRSGTFVFDMGEPKSMYEIAQQMVVNSGLPIEIVETGLRDGEKLTEELDFGGVRIPTRHPKVFEVEDRAEINWAKYRDLHRIIEHCWSEQRIRTELLELAQ